MSDFEKVFEIRFDTRSAEKGVARIEQLADRAERQLKDINQLSRKSGVSIGGPGATRNAKQLAQSLSQVSDRALRMRARMEQAFAALSTGAAKNATRVRGVAAATDRVSEATRRASEAGAHLDKIIRKATRAGSAGMRTVERAVKGTERAVAKTDERYRKFMQRRGERAKARALGEVERRIRRIGQASRLATTSVSGLVARLALIVGAMSKIRDVGREYMNFESRITTAAAKFSVLDKAMEPGREGFRRLKEEVRAAARETEHSAGAIAGAVDFWAKAGKTAEQTKAVIPMTLDFASANTDAAGAALDMARAGDILSDTLGAFKMNAKDPAILLQNTARVADVMSAAANQANFSAEELFESFTTAGPTLKAVGSDIEETSALLAAMANAGIKGSAAGTQLKMSIANLSAMTGPQEAALAKLGVTVKDADGNFRGLTTIIRDLNEATKDMGTADRFQVFAKAVGRRAIPSFINLLAEGKTNLDAMTQKLREAGGETQRLAGIIRQSAEKQMAKFWNKISDIGYLIIEETQLFKNLGEMFNRVDWAGVAKTVSEKVVPALKAFGKFVADVLIPAIGHTADTLKTIFAPALWVVEKVFGKAKDGGEALARVLSVLATAWVLYRTRLMAVMAINVVQYFTTLATSARGAALAQGSLSRATAATATNLGTATTAASGLSRALGAIGILVATWQIANIIQKQLIDPLYEADLAAKHLKNTLDEGKAAQKRGHGSKRTIPYWEEQITETNKQLHKDRVRLDEIARMDYQARVLYGGEAAEISARIKENEQHVKNAANSIAVIRQRKNVQKYKPAGQGISKQTEQIVGGGRLMEIDENWATGSLWPGEIPGPAPMPGPENYGTGSSPMVEYLGQSIPGQGQSYQEGVTNNTYNIDARGMNPKELRKELDLRDRRNKRKRNRENAKALSNAAADEGLLEL